MKIKFVQDELSNITDYCGLKIWEKPKDICVYAIGADVSEGIGHDASVAQVINCRNGLLVASFWSNQIDPDNFAATLYKLGYFYNKASICLEINNNGSAVATHLGGAIGGLAYPNLYRRIVFDEYTQKRTRQIGFKTTSSTKPRIIENLKAGLRDGDIVLFDKTTIQELGSFIRDEKTGRIGAKGSAHDDRVMALALAWEQALQLREGLNQSESSYQNNRIVYDESTGFPIYG